MTVAQNGSQTTGPSAVVYQAATQAKPWGHEVIFAVVEGKYVGKIIHVTAGQSLAWVGCSVPGGPALSTYPPVIMPCSVAPRL